MWHDGRLLIAGKLVGVAGFEESLEIKTLAEPAP